jgi:dTDP-4-amino-4,6-dideoxygalactose transaminase
MAVSSFHPVKSITTGEGGVVLTNDTELAQKAIRLRSHGVTRDSQAMNFDDGMPWHYEQIDLGYNYRITDIQCALGLSQLSRLDSWVARRSELARRYDAAFVDTDLHGQLVADDVLSARHLYVVRIPHGHRNEVGTKLRADGILVNLHYAPIHLQPYYRRLGFVVGDFPETEIYGTEALSLPLYPALIEDEQDMVVKKLLHYYQESKK